MKNKTLYRPILCALAFALILISLPATLYAETQYVSDKLVITMRRGAGNDYMIIRTLKSGEALEIIKEKDKYYKVKSKGGEEGWVLKQYITPDTPKSITIARLNRKITRLNASIAKLKEEKGLIQSSLVSEQGSHKTDSKKLERSLNKANDQIYRTNKKLKEITNKYKALVKDSSDIVKTVSERDKLRKDFKNITTEMSAIKDKNKSLSNRNIVIWFLAGGFVLLIGWIIGQISKKKRSGFH
ncbi:MAG: TIGR04211 family SH3 domain-containing protein [Proteobacteria bacterium]|nr:TIGR04211 family SH3 domain-containing protein [Pseudomonadota bacterium]